MQIDKPVLGQLTQGTIFTAATAENYVGVPVWGLCITARCDVAHENKTRVFNYVPVVRYEDWIRGDGARVITDRLSVDQLGIAKAFLSQKGKSVSLLESYSPTYIAEKFFPLKNGDRDNEKFHTIAEKLSRIGQASDAIPLSQEKLTEITLINKKIAEKAIKELWSNQLSGYYFLPDIGITEHTSECGYVVLLREIHHIARHAAAAIANGTSKDSSEGILFPLKDHNFSVFDFSYPTAKLKSPWTEHLMQQFSILFGRIGLPDSSTETLNILYKAMNHGG